MITRLPHEWKRKKGGGSRKLKLTFMRRRNKQGLKLDCQGIRDAMMTGGVNCGKKGESHFFRFPEGEGAASKNLKKTTRGTDLGENIVRRRVEEKEAVKKRGGREASFKKNNRRANYTRERGDGRACAVTKIYEPIRGARLDGTVSFWELFSALAVQRRNTDIESFNQRRTFNRRASMTNFAAT